MTPSRAFAGSSDPQFEIPCRRPIPSLSSPRECANVLPGNPAQPEAFVGGHYVLRGSEKHVD
jgi:hypothetical protein